MTNNTNAHPECASIEVNDPRKVMCGVGDELRFPNTRHVELVVADDSDDVTDVKYPVTEECVSGTDNSTSSPTITK